MDPIYPWLDPIEVRHLADQLMRPVKQPAVSVSDAGFNDAFVGFANAPEPAAVPFEAVIHDPEPEPAPVAKQEPFEESVPETLPEPVPAPTDLTPATPEKNESPVPARGPFLERIQHFRDWMRHHFSATGIFILDRDGAVIFDESNHGRLHFLARSLALASRRPGSTSGNVHVKIGAGATLEVIPVETAYGCLVLGAVVPDSMDPTAVAAVMKALSEIASPVTGSA